MTYLVTLIIVAILAYMVFMAIKSSTGLFEPKSPPQTRTGYKPTVRPAARSVDDDFQLVLKGQGVYSSEPVYLDHSIYRIQYQFPEDCRVTVQLIAADGSARKAIVYQKAGYLNATFHVPMSKYYLFEVAPEQAEASWALVINRL